MPVALKVASPDILNKSDIGAVKLGLQTEEEVRHAFAQVMSSAKAAVPKARIEGVLVSPLRATGVELLPAGQIAPCPVASALRRC